MHPTAGRIGADDSVDAEVAVMDSVEDFAAWVEQSDRELQEWMKGLEEEEARVNAWLAKQVESDPLEGLS